MWISRLRRVRKTTMVLGAVNSLVVVSGGVLVMVSSPECDRRQVYPIVSVAVVAAIKIAAMVKMGIAQELTAKSIVDSGPPNRVVDSVFRHERRKKYKTWLWWTRFAMIITVLQLIGAAYLVFHVAKHVSHDGMPRDCVLGLTSDVSWWKRRLQVVFVIIVSFVAIAQCFTGSDILQWRSFYSSQDDAWKSHYQEVFDHGIREVLCCLGRVQYLSVLEEDEVYSVARLLGDLVAYRASGTGHLELLAGLTLLQGNSQFRVSYEGSVEAPLDNLQEAATFHKFAEAAYTGLLLDLGRNPALFLCTWICRQGILTPWTRNRRPKLDGDNWWRGHATAFLKFINYPPHILRGGRICQEKCKATYFVVVLHYLRCVVIAVRGTETPEDLITDGLGCACPLSAEDLDGLINSIDIHTNANQTVSSTSTHYGHSGIVEATRDLFMQIEGDPRHGESESVGFLSSLLGVRCECAGYSIRIVGHSLGGAIAALLGIRLYSRFPNLRVFAYGPLPCVDSVVADACSEFVTSIVLNNEFSARLSIGSILRLRAAAITPLAQDDKTDTALIFRLARRFLYVSNYQRSEMEATRSEGASSIMPSKDSINHLFQDSKAENQQSSPWSESDPQEITNDEFINSFRNAGAEAHPLDDPVSQFMETVPSSENKSAGDPPEMFLPGRVIHIIPRQDNTSTPLWKGWVICEMTDGYEAYVANRECFKDIVVSHSMFLDHLPWRCRHAMQKVLEDRNLQDLVGVSQMV